MFLELTKVGMFLFVFTVPLNMAEANISIILTSM